MKSDSEQVQRCGEVCCEFASRCPRHGAETTSQGCVCVICLFDCDVNGVISYHILCLFSQTWRWSQRLVVRLLDFMDKMHAGPQHPEGGQSTLPACLQPLSPDTAAAALEGTPVTLSQGCGGGEGTNTQQHKEHTRLTQERQQQQPPTLHTL